MATLFRRAASPVWYARVQWSDGRLRRLSTRRRSRREAQRWAEELEAAQDRLRLQGPAGDDLAALAHQGRPIEDVALDFLRLRTAQGRSQRHLADLRRDLERCWRKARIGTLGELTTERVEEWYYAEAEATSPATAGRLLRNLSSFTRWCVRRRWLLHNPLDAVERISVRPKAKMPLRMSQVRALFRVAPWPRASFYMAAALLGLRNSELRRLRWDHLDLESGLLVFDAGKVSRVDTLPVVHPLLSALRQIREKTRNPKVFRLPPYRIRAEDFARAGAPGGGVHDLRRTMASRLPDLTGAPPDVVRTIGRWAASDTASRYYQTIPVRVLRHHLDHYAAAIFGEPRVCRGWAVELPQMAEAEAGSG